jgi:hypothetical protein
MDSVIPRPGSSKGSGSGYSARLRPALLDFAEATFPIGKGRRAARPYPFAVNPTPFFA